MFKFRQNAILRFNLLVIFFFTLAGIFIIGKATIIMFVERDDWNKIKEKNIKRDVPIEQRRGNFLADNGELLVSSLPQYRLKFDFKYYNPTDKKDEERINAERDTMWKIHLHELCVGMNEILPGTSVAELESRFRNGLEKQRGGYQPYRGHVSYQQYKQILELPIINQGKIYSGLHDPEEEKNRENILGSTGNSTFGVARTPEINGKKVQELSGLEKKYNNYLKGEAGIGTRAKVGGKWITTQEKKLPKDGYDVQTTLNSQMMEICRTELEAVLKEKHLPAGWAILMETKTGDIKAVVNLARDKNGEYTDSLGNEKIKFGNKSIFVQKNHALCERYEPGSIFKTVAITAILADGKLTTKDSVYSYKDGVYNFNGHRVSDEMYRDNGVGMYSMKDAIMYSSNISMVQYIRKAYLNCPEQYTNTLHRFGLGQNYHLVDNEATPYIKRPGTKDWDGFSLNSMSYGYAVEMTAINMVSFYNTIANGGRQMQPRLVKAILKNGKVVEEFPTKVINEQLFPKSVADEVTYMLKEVVNGKSIIAKKSDWRYGKLDGTGKAAYSELFAKAGMSIAGKTGTAKQYNSNDKLLSFCGFFPAEAPEYTLIVQIMYDYELDPRPKKDKDDRTKGYGGGNTSGAVFKNIAEKIMTRKLAIPLEKESGEDVNLTPAIKAGDINEAYFLLNSVGILDSIPEPDTKKDWGKIEYENNQPGEKTEEYDFEKDPVKLDGMGAKEATYLLQKQNFKVKLVGFGTVMSDSIEFAGDTVVLKLGYKEKHENKKTNNKKTNNKKSNNKKTNNKKTK